MLFIATDTDGLYTGHPTRDPDAQPLPRVEAITTEVLPMTAGGAGALGTGGMAARLEAASKGAAAGSTEERRVGQERFRTFRSWWAPVPSKKKPEDQRNHKHTHT